jgi:hypothetical protein
MRQVHPTEHVLRLDLNMQLRQDESAMNPPFFELALLELEPPG